MGLVVGRASQPAIQDSKFADISESQQWRAGKPALPHQNDPLPNHGRRRELSGRAKCPPVIQLSGAMGLGSNSAAKIRYVGGCSSLTVRMLTDSVAKDDAGDGEGVRALNWQAGKPAPRRSTEGGFKNEMMPPFACTCENLGKISMQFRSTRSAADSRPMKPRGDYRRIGISARCGRDACCKYIGAA